MDCPKHLDFPPKGNRLLAKRHDSAESHEVFWLIQDFLHSAPRALLHRFFDYAHIRDSTFCGCRKVKAQPSDIGQASGLNLYWVVPVRVQVAGGTACLILGL